MGGISYQYNGDGNRIQQDALKYILDLQPGLAQVIGDSGGNRFVHGPRGMHAAHDGATWAHPLTDGLGSVRGYADTNGEVLSTVHYSDYGVPDEPITGPAFTGEWRDATGVQYHRARYLSPELGSWLSLDPFEGMIDEPITLNGYIYAGGDPVNNIDSSGMLFWSFPPGRGSRFNTLYDPGQYVARGQRYAHAWIERWLEEKNGFWETHLEFPGTGRRIDAIVFEQTASHINPSPVYFTAPIVGNVFEIEPADVRMIVAGYTEVGLKTGFLRAGHGNPYCLSNQCRLPERDRWNPERPMTWDANPYVSSYSQASYEWRQVQWQFGNSLSHRALNNGRGPERVDPNALGAAGIPEAYWILLPVPCSVSEPVGHGDRLE